MWPENNIRVRERMMLEAVQAGAVEYQWHPLTIGGRVTLYVMADALKWAQQGAWHRGAVSARLASDIATELDAILPTPMIVDLIWRHAALQLPPQPQPISALTSAVLRHSRAVDEAIGGQAGLVTGWKHWCTTRASLTTDKATNYGWHVPGAMNPWRGIKTHPSVWGNYRVIQPAAEAHGPWHVDYSQFCQLVRRDCLLDGRADDLGRILAHPTLCKLVAVDGPLPLSMARRRDTEPCMPAETDWAAVIPLRGRS